MSSISAPSPQAPPKCETSTIDQVADSLSALSLTPTTATTTVVPANTSSPSDKDSLNQSQETEEKKDKDNAPLSTPKPEQAAATATTTPMPAPTASTALAAVLEEELTPEEAALRAKGLKSTHRPGFFIHIDSPKRLRIQAQSKTFDVDRYCPHANADMLKWGVLRSDLTLRCGVHYWGFQLENKGQCIAHPDETLNACQVHDTALEW